MCILRFYPFFPTESRFATEPHVLQTVSRFAIKLRFVIEPRFATVPCGAVRRNVQVWCDKMCGFGASKCADVMRQNMVRRNLWVRCVRVCGYNAKCRNGAMKCGNGATECGDGATEWQCLKLGEPRWLSRHLVYSWRGRSECGTSQATLSISCYHLLLNYISIN